jgi:hypothetical protein
MICQHIYFYLLLRFIVDTDRYCRTIVTTAHESDDETNDGGATVNDMKPTKRTAAITPRKRTTITAKSATTAIAVTSVESAIEFARTVTPDNFGASLAMVNRNHGVTHATRNTNRFNGTRIEYTQNALFVANERAQLSDVQLAFVWCVCFPMATGGCFDPTRAADDASMRVAIVKSAGIVAGARRTYNAGKHGCPAPTVPSIRYGSSRVVFAPPASA